jgi:tetratricopeptide (TPR) repeat protein
MLDRRGHQQESLAMRRRAYELDPLNLQISAALADALCKTGHQDAALKQITRTLELDPEFWDAHHTLGLFHLHRGRYAEAIVAFEKSGKVSSLAHAYARAGDRTRAASMLHRLEHEATRRYVTPLDFAVVYTGLGENDRAFEWLERAFRERVGPVRLLDAECDTPRSRRRPPVRVPSTRQPSLAEDRPATVGKPSERIFNTRGLSAVAPRSGERRTVNSSQRDLAR